MLINDTFKAALLISLGIHSIILVAMPQLARFNFRKKFDKIEIIYIKPQATPKIEKDQTQAQNNNLPPPPAYAEKEQIIKKSLQETNKPEIKVSHDEAETKPKISLPPATSEKIRNPEYLNYYQVIRAKIKKAAYQRYIKMDTGQVYISFTVSNDGMLEDVRLIEESSVQNQYLWDIGLKSIRDASPFPPFPKELNYPQLSFNIIISFETD
ncbi:MAG: TonB family protein [Candidatus Omnitrophica bacterium]|nr:TonB family protein [Candidatus Omnitrophota bacterium]